MLEITNLTNNQVDEDFLKKIAETVLKEEGKKGVISLVLVGPQKIKHLNRKYRKKNRVTDVLSFPATLPKKNFVIPPTAKNQIGEIFICLREIKKTAKRQNSTFEKELARVLIHGILHLLGYNHYKDEEAKIMEEKQNKYLSKII
jgi:probable rRNA maturation factor